MPPPNPYGNAYFDPNSWYGATQDYSTAPVVGGPGGYLSNTPQAAYLRMIAPFASGEDPFSQFVRSQYSRAYGGYQAAAATNPNLGFGYGQQDYLRGLGEHFFRALWSQRPADQRGLNLPRYGGGRVQWQRTFQQ
jgi:hypothetical protein